MTKYDRSLTARKGSRSSQRPQFTIATSPFQEDYNDEMDYRKKELFHEALFELIEEDLVEVAWEKYREGEKVHKVYLNLDCLDKAFRMSSITPKEEKLELILESISALSSHSWSWVVDWLMDAEECIHQFRIPVGCDLDDQAANKDLVKTLLALPEVDNYVPKRRFSQQVLLDSKRFEQVVEKRY